MSTHTAPNPSWLNPLALIKISIYSIYSLTISPNLCYKKCMGTSKENGLILSNIVD